MVDYPDPFKHAFKALTGHSPFKWQQRLYRRLVANDIPPSCDLPTGLGKTAVIPIWLIALAYGAGALPRRLVYIVNRRTVVDQATEEAASIRSRLLGPPDETRDVLDDLRHRLANLAGDAESIPLAISTLRGEFADNGEWKANPARPALIIGTVDMIGSRVLFQGYGDSRYGRPHHAGLLGQDTLIVHDEAHLTPAFGDLLRAISSLQEADRSPRPIRVLELSATARPGIPGADSVFALADEDWRDRGVLKRIRACKRLKLHTVSDAKAVAPKLVELAQSRHESHCRILIYVRTPEEARSVHELLPGEAQSKELLTGTLRGHERDELVRKPLFRWFRGGPPLEGTVYLVSTSAGEVGVDLDADHMVCDLTTLESMIQRLGRVNRRGNARSQVDVVAEKAAADADAPPPKGERNPDLVKLFKARQATWVALSGLPKARDGRLNASPEAVRRLAGRTDAWSPQPQILPLTDVLLDAWALTSLGHRLPSQPAIEDWLHGVTEGDPPETFVAWRAELSRLAEAGVAAELVERAFDVFPIRAVERLRDRSYRVQEALAKIARRHPEARALLVRDGFSWVTLQELAPDDKEARRRAQARLAYATLILPAEVGGLRGGYLDGDAREPAAQMDVAEIARAGQPERQRVWVQGDEAKPFVGGELLPGLVTRFRIRLGEEEASEEDPEAKRSVLEYRVAPADTEGAPGEGDSKTKVALGHHIAAVVQQAARIAASLRLPSDLAEALKLAALWHDRGKARELWQRAAANSDPENPLAKSGRNGLNWRVLEGYRHELGSLLEAAADPGIQRQPECPRDLVLHLIAVHHGWARPHFDPGAHDRERGSTEQNQDAVVEAMRRYARLQDRFGRWGLAWLESLLRCADGLASAAPVGRSATAP